MKRSQEILAENVALMLRQSVKRGQLRIILLIICCCCLALGNKPAEQGARNGIVIGYSSAIFVGVDRKDVQIALDMWTAELGKAAGLKQAIRATIFESLEEMVAGIRQKAVDFVGMTMLDYLKIRSQVGLEPLLTGTNRGQAGEEYALIVHKGAPWTELKQLRGKTSWWKKAPELAAVPFCGWIPNCCSSTCPPARAFFSL
jgi:ABC-type phosphate/phosphonate transport system substrate-binding protein